jgi:hypothetical protein
LGFDDLDKDIRRVVHYASSKDIVIIAAASNSGSRVPYRRVAYPARMNGHVISIRSATSQSERAAASPLPSANDDNFMLLGEAIRAACVQTQSIAYFSGSSFATPIAAGIAALIIEFSKHKHTKPKAMRGAPYVKADAQKMVCTYEGIRKIFRDMATVPDQRIDSGCALITPWQLFAHGRRTIDVGVHIAVLMKNIR